MKKTKKREKKETDGSPLLFFFFFSIPHHITGLLCVLFCISYQKQTRKPLNRKKRREKKNHRWRWKRFFACFVSTDSELSTKKRNESNIDVLFFFHQNVFYQYKIALTIKQRGLDSDSVERKNNCQSNWCWQ